MTPWSVTFVADAGDPRAPGLSLGRAFAIFSRQPTAFALTLALVVLAGFRLVLGPLTWTDAAVVAVLVALQPLSEWLIHVFLLHFRPRTLWGVHLDLHMARLHRQHHVDPDDPRWWFIPKRSGLIGFGILAALSWWLLPVGPAVTAVFSGVALGLFYEWIHYLCHTSYRAKGAWYRRLWRHHRLHHFKNEHYWMGVTRHLGDRLLGTMADVKEVETSPTCRNLHDGAGGSRGSGG